MAKQRIENGWYREFPAIRADLMATIMTVVAMYGEQAPEVEK
jgi:hypothetical protein